jgi:N-formylglutamate deformylase
MTTPIYTLRKGRTPLLVSMPHVGTVIPPEIESRMTDVGRRRDDTDWHLERLYDWIDELGASVLVATHSRYVIDLNRPPDGVSMYPGQDNTPVCPLDTFDREPFYPAGGEPDAAEVERRLQAYWHPYHQALATELARIRDEHGTAVLWDAHSVRSVVPRFFPGRLPDINLGTVHGTSCGPGLGERMLAVAEADRQFTSVLNGRFVGGHVTRRHGNPARNIHAIQLELSQITYMEEKPPYSFDEARANRIRPVLKAMLDGALQWAARR